MARIDKRTTAILTGIGAACAAGIGYFLSKRLTSRGSGEDDLPAR